MNMWNDPNSRSPKLHDHTTYYEGEINILRPYDAQNAGRYTLPPLRNFAPEIP